MIIKIPPMDESMLRLRFLHSFFNNLLELIVFVKVRAVFSDDFSHPALMKSYTSSFFWQHLKRNDKSPEFHGQVDLEVPQSFCCNFFYSETFVHQELSNKLQEKLFNERDLCIKGTIMVSEKWAWCLTVHIGIIQVYFHTLTLPLIVSPRQIISWAKKT